MQALSDVRLTGFEDRYPHQLSGGQQQRVAFARAIAIHPSCILFDEPFSALDAGLREEMRSEVRSLVSQKNITSIFVTHDQLEAMEISDSIIVLDNGRILQQGRPEDIYCSPSRKEVAGFVGHANWLDDSSMVRPENIRIDELHTPGPDYVYMKLPVTSVQFLGEHYEVQVMNGRFPGGYLQGRNTRREQKFHCQSTETTLYIFSKERISNEKEKYFAVLFRNNNDPRPGRLRHIFRQHGFRVSPGNRFPGVRQRRSCHGNFLSRSSLRAGNTFSGRTGRSLRKGCCILSFSRRPCR